MPSTAISRIAYEAETGELYRYYEVPRRVYDAFRKAGSKGRFFDHDVKDRTPFQHIYDPDGGRHAA